MSRQKSSAQYQLSRQIDVSQFIGNDILGKHFNSRSVQSRVQVAAGSALVSKTALRRALDPLNNPAVDLGVMRLEASDKSYYDKNPMLKLTFSMTDEEIERRDYLRYLVGDTESRRAEDKYSIRLGNVAARAMTDEFIQEIRGISLLPASAIQLNPHY